jgi:hypothetical protein
VRDAFPSFRGSLVEARSIASISPCSFPFFFFSLSRSLSLSRPLRLPSLFYSSFSPLAYFVFLSIVFFFVVVYLGRRFLFADGGVWLPLFPGLFYPIPIRLFCFRLLFLVVFAFLSPSCFATVIFVLA